LVWVTKLRRSIVFNVSVFHCIELATSHTASRADAVVLFRNLSAQRNETETKPLWNRFETVLFRFHFVVRTVFYVKPKIQQLIFCHTMGGRAVCVGLAVGAEWGRGCEGRVRGRRIGGTLACGSVDGWRRNKWSPARAYVAVGCFYLLLLFRV